MRVSTFVVVVFLIPLSFSESFAQSGLLEAPSLPVLRQADADELAAVHSDDEAKTFFSTRLRDALGSTTILPDTNASGSNRTSTKTKTFQAPTPSPEWIEIGGRLTGELATKQLATSLKQAANGDDPRRIRSVLEQTREQRQWLTTGNARPELDRAVKLATVLSDLTEIAPVTASSSMVEEYAAYLDRTFPRVADADDSWLDMAEREGPAGVRRRLMEFWQDHSTSPQLSETEKQALVSHYFQTRLKPILLAQLTASAIRAEATAEYRARTYWIGLQTWLDKIRETKGLARLCGTWQWTIHNHQHHQDQKIAMVFPPPDAGSFTGPRPAKTVVLGDAIYLRWEFPGMIQEDSLLFTGEGQRVEGSFVNSSGAWGSITGKRVAACAR